jgi:hypothetical protein
VTLQPGPDPVSIVLEVESTRKLLKRKKFMNKQQKILLTTPTIKTDLMF